MQSQDVKRIVGDPQLPERSWFDLRTDGAERRPKEAPADAAEALATRAEHIRAARPAASPAASEGELSDAKREMLETLGYIDD